MRILARWKSRLLGILCLVFVLGSALDLTAPSAKGAEDDDSSVARSLAAMLRAGRTVISRHQAQINNPDIGDKGFTGKSVLIEALEIYKEMAGEDPESIDPKSRSGRLLRAQMDAIVEVIDRQLEAELHVLSRRRIGTGQRHHAADEDAFRADTGREGA